MRKLILFMHMSLDGYIAAADGTSSLTAEAGANDSDTDESVFEVVAELTKDADTLLLGRVVANDLLGYWLTAEAKDPDLSRGARAYARWATGAHKAVLSNAEEQLPWENSELLLATTDADMERTVSALKRRQGMDIVVHGGVRTAQALTRLDLIDEFQLVLHPEAHGDGKPLFKDLPRNRTLHLIEVAALKAGAVFLRYRR